MASAPQRLTVAIIGAGVAGPVLGLQILAHPRLAMRYAPILFDQAPDPALTSIAEERRRKVQPSAGAAVGIFANGLYPLYKLGLRSELEAVSTSFEGLRLFQTPNDGTYKQTGACKNPTWSSDLQDGARSVSRTDLQRLLVDAFLKRGGEIQWNSKFESLRTLEDGRVELTFAGTAAVEADIVVGADGGFSRVRRHILQQRNATTADERWLPDYMSQSGFYAISRIADEQRKLEDPEWATETHAQWLQDGILSSAPLPGGRIRWDLILAAPEAPPPVDETAEVRIPTDAPAWATALMPSPYNSKDSIKVLSQFSNTFHPVAGTFGNLLEHAERIIRRPLRQRVWKADEIQHGGVVLIGDASRLMLPSSGQGTGFAIEDATFLAQQLLKCHCDNPSAVTLKTALEQYARERASRSQMMATVAYWAGELSMGRTWYWRILRDWLPAGSDRKKSTASKDAWPFNARYEVESKS